MVWTQISGLTIEHRDQYLSVCLDTYV